MSALIQRKKHLNKTKKKLKRFVFKPGRSMKTLERTYFKEIKAIITQAKDIVNKVLTPKISLLVSLRDSLRPKADAASDIRHDSWVDALKAAMATVRIEFEDTNYSQKAASIAFAQAKKINKINAEDFGKNFQKALGVPTINLEPWLQEEMKAFTATNVSYIKSIPEVYFQQIESRISNMVQQGRVTDEIANEIQNRYNVSESKAALIARDQTNKFNGSLSQLRQQEVGVTQYEWSTSLDERVRPEHAEREGETFDWSDPPEDGPPGIPINCRCEALAVIDFDSEE